MSVRRTGQSAVRNMSWAVVRLLCVFLSLAWLASCGTDEIPQTISGGGGGPIVQPPGGPGTGGSECLIPGPGCPCSSTGQVSTCYLPPVDTGYGGLECSKGTMTCSGGTWGSCTNVTASFFPTAGALITAPSSCNPCDPRCVSTSDTPTDTDLTPTNSDDVEYDPIDGGVKLTVTGSGMSGTATDTDGDGYPDVADECPGSADFRAPCDGDTTNDGFFHVLPQGGPAEIDPLSLSARVRTADVYFLMDTTGSMGGEINNLQADLTSGSFIAGCPGGVIGAIQCTIPDAWFGVGRFDDYPVSPYGDAGWNDVIFENLLNITGSVADTQTAVNSLGLHFGSDSPEGNTQALWAVASGDGLDTFLSAQTGCAAGEWGYPCFRDGTIPIVVQFTDAPYHNGPDTSLNYSNANFNGGVTLPATSTWVTGNDTSGSAFNIGTIDGRWVSYRGDLCGASNNFTGCASWAGGGDRVFRFDVATTRDVTFTLSGTATVYPTVSLVDNAVTTILQCDAWPSAPPNFTRTLTPGTYYVVVDNYTWGCGDYQLSIGEPPVVAGGFTPVTWAESVSELNNASVRVVTVQSCGGSSWCAQGEPDANSLANATGAVNSLGSPYVFPIPNTGTGLSTAVVDAIVDIADFSRLDVSVQVVDDPSTAAVDERDFVQAITTSGWGPGSCTGISGSTYTQCLPGTTVGFNITFQNDFLPPAATDQVFNFDVNVLGDGTFVLQTVPVRIVVPRELVQYETDGYYTRDYDASTVCEMPPQFPDWGSFEYTVDTPSDTQVRFEIRSAQTTAGLAAATPVYVTSPGGSNPVDVGGLLQAAGVPNGYPYLRVTATLQASTDQQQTPILEGFQLQYHCLDGE